MLSLSHQHCLNHSAREAVAQCPQCKYFFCRECITEHDDRILCAACLRLASQTAAKTRSRFRALAPAALSSAGLFTAAIFFYWVGQILLLIPTSFHDGTIWQSIGGWQK